MINLFSIYEKVKGLTQLLTYAVKIIELSKRVGYRFISQLLFEIIQLNLTKSPKIPQLQSTTKKYFLVDEIKLSKNYKLTKVFLTPHC